MISLVFAIIGYTGYLFLSTVILWSYSKGISRLQSEIIQTGEVPINERGYWYIKNIRTPMRGFLYHITERLYGFYGLWIIVFVITPEYFMEFLIWSGLLAVLVISASDIISTVRENVRLNNEILKILDRD